jgi:hypothetical protein
MAAEALRLLVEQLTAKYAGRSSPVTHRMLDFAIVKRASTGPAPFSAGHPSFTGKDAKSLSM